MLDLIESGRYASRTQVLRESEELRGWREATLNEFQDSIARSKAAAAAGEGESVQAVVGPLIAEIRAMGNARK
ncbi:type II toxin-antitoxin system ParD family antitoxin [Mitsuaria sp. GD03876]|uniref:type II toxin-antitoxin system ParD family antitoxin n=1 Tax=Mitsuaria sp. GD03876 TaxID=2975399 RepID=UPI00244D0FD8|nr:type II toxin-antitoxin system ParD family antitoxin [Mitsuaria sp. GD03876]MDH0864055.1 type II toxin-antitoxin system ParD family antitoxin [Mitsuaria sp. GD03876]